MATRVIENRRDRLVTILIAPLMSCSARLPVYTLLIGAFIPQQAILGGTLGLQGLTLFGLYLLGIVVAVAVALILRRTLLPGQTPPFVMELPSYKVPEARVVLHRMVERGWEFLYQAGTLILAVTILVWAAGYYPRATDLESSLRQRQTVLQSRLERFHGGDLTISPAEVASWQAEYQQLEDQLAGAQLRQSYLGRLGHAIEPVVRPLGWDWRIGCAVLASFPAREVVVGTLGVIYNLGEGTEESLPLRDGLRNATRDGSEQRALNTPVALSIMVFFALCAQCVSTLAVIKRETHSWRWPAFAFTYMTLCAYLGAWVTYQLGMWLIGPR
jgi:ferrous iron transport protein B